MCFVGVGGGGVSVGVVSNNDVLYAPTQRQDSTYINRGALAET